MGRCVNNECKKNPFKNELKMVLASMDGDFACCKECLKKYKKQRNNFFENIHNNEWYQNWLGMD